jgi:hypothetical protein
MRSVTMIVNGSGSSGAFMRYPQFLAPLSAGGGRDTTRCLGDRKKQCHRTTGEALKSKMFVEAESDFIFCLDNEREDGRLGPHGACNRIDDQQTADAVAAKSSIDGKTTDEACRQGRITRQPLGPLGR